MRRLLVTLVGFFIGSSVSITAADSADALHHEPGLVGYWKLQGDCRDYSPHGNHAVNHGVNLTNGTFNGVDSFIEVPSSPSLKPGTGDFSICAWIYTEKDLDDVVGDVVDFYDPTFLRGITLSIQSTGSGYQGQGNDRQVSFGIDNARTSEWEDCGRPSKTSRYISNSMLTFRGHLYAAITDAREEKDWCHVFRYESGKKWVDCGRVGTHRTTGVGPLLVHDGELYAVTWTYDWTRVGSGKYDPGRLYRYAGGTRWIDCGQPGAERTLNTAASFKGNLYVGGGPETWGVFIQTNANQWFASNIFEKRGPRRLFPHTMCRYNGKLFTGYPCVFAFDGREWSYAGLPGPLETTPPLQTHSMTVYQGKLCAGTWPEAKVAHYFGGEQWQELGRVGVDGTEVNSLHVYNGKLYGGSIPRAEVCRYDGKADWTSLRRFYSPTNWQPAPPAKPTRQQVAEWSRVTSLATHGGRLFAGIGSCTSALVDTPADPDDVLGKVFSMEAGRCVSFDEDLGPGWKHLAAVRQGGQLELFVDGRKVASSSSFNPTDYDVSTDRPLRIGFGQMDYFCGRLSEVRFYKRALRAAEIRKLWKETQAHHPPHRG
jgi:hypothetical protein